MNRFKPEYDAIVVGSGPNGLSAAIVLQQAGLHILILEAATTIGGGMRSAELTLPGFTHDICSAIHPLASGSPFFQTLPLQQFGLNFIYPKYAAAHPFDDGSSSLLQSAISDTASILAEDQYAYSKLFTPLVAEWPQIAPDVPGPFRVPHHPLAMARFGM